jgi:hypothetical protein
MLVHYVSTYAHRTGQRQMDAAAVVPTTKAKLVLSSLNTLQYVDSWHAHARKARIWRLKVTTYSDELCAMIFPSMWEPLRARRVSSGVGGCRLG